MKNPATNCIFMFKVLVVLAFVTLINIPAQALRQTKMSLTRTINEADFVVSGIVSVNEIIKDPKSQIPCGVVQTLRDVKILREPDGASTHLDQTRPTITFRSFNFSYHEGNKILVFGQFSTPIKFDTVAMDSADIKTGKKTSLDCSSFYDRAPDYLSVFSSLITSYKIVDQKKHEWMMDVVTVDGDRLMDMSRKGLSLNSNIANGIRGWVTNAQQTILCLSDVSCTEEVKRLQSPVDIDYGAQSVQMSGSEYLIEVDALLRVFGER